MATVVCSLLLRASGGKTARTGARWVARQRTGNPPLWQPAQLVGSHDGADYLGVTVHSALRQAPQHAGSGEERLDRVAGRGERIGHSLVHDNDGSARSERFAGGGERLERVAQVVEHLEKQNEVVTRTVRPFGADVSDFEVDPLGDTLLDGVLAGAADRLVVTVDAV